MNTVEQRKSVIEQLNNVKEVVSEKMSKPGYVVAGYGGDTYYAYVGSGRGYEGAALTPVSYSPVIFNSQRAAQREANNGTYRNGRGELIRLEVVEASEYFAKVLESINKNIKFIQNL